MESPYSISFNKIRFCLYMFNSRALRLIFEFLLILLHLWLHHILSLIIPIGNNY